MRSTGSASVKLWAYPILLAGAALGADAAYERTQYGLLSAGALDEVAHLTTAALGLLVLACFVELPRQFYIAALIASVAIDLDHIPLYLGLLGDEAGRPFTHSLATVVIFAGAAVVGRRHRAVLAGAAIGLVLHFARDIVEGAAGRENALARSANGLDWQPRVVPGNDHRIHGRPAGAGECRPPARARPPLPSAVPVLFGRSYSGQPRYIR
jgi:hypothetical protein